jgi:hypothetical protein
MEKANIEYEYKHDISMTGGACEQHSAHFPTCLTSFDIESSNAIVIIDDLAIYSLPHIGCKISCDWTLSLLTCSFVLAVSKF